MIHLTLCRDCFKIFERQFRCPRCNSPRIVSHPDLLALEIAHIDCDAFYASIEKRDNPSIRNLPVIVGGLNRGVVTTCCYIARINGVESAMPIFKAKKLCPNAIIIAPRMNHYRNISNSIKKMLTKLSPAIEFVALDEAYIDLRGTRRIHGEAPAIKLAKISKEIEASLGITISIGLSYNKFLAKVCSELEKPRGFSIIGQSESTSFLRDKPISKIPGIGKKTAKLLESNGMFKIGDILKSDKQYLTSKIGSFGETIWFLAQGIDNRKIVSNKPFKSMSCEKTFQTNQIQFDTLIKFLWDITENICSRLKTLSLMPEKLSLKLKTINFKVLTTSVKLEKPSNSPEILFKAAEILLKKNISKGPFRLIGLNVNAFVHQEYKKPNKNFFDPDFSQTLATEKAMDNIRSKFGTSSIFKGRSLKNLK